MLMEAKNRQGILSVEIVSLSLSFLQVILTLSWPVNHPATSPAVVTHAPSACARFTSAAYIPDQSRGGVRFS